MAQMPLFTGPDRFSWGLFGGLAVLNKAVTTSLNKDKAVSQKVCVFPWVLSKGSEMIDRDKERD